MAKYLIRGSYAPSGVRALINDGGSRRREVVEQAVRSLGGSLEAFYFAFGEHDLYIIVDLPDHKAAIAASLVTNASGTVGSSTSVLLLPEEVDVAAAIAVDYVPPGS
ncbi:MAG: GYD domain-containing protein [Caldilineaceae bacterium]|nr:GYD domain-containing protein [Caldilineaceae bacterium]